MILSEAIDKVRPSVVQIQAASRVGTGFFVTDSAHVATAYHVIDGAGENEVLVGFSHENSENMRANWTLVDVEIIATTSIRTSRF